jgi:hypothetical protein
MENSMVIVKKRILRRTVEPKKTESELPQPKKEKQVKFNLTTKRHTTGHKGKKYSKRKSQTVYNSQNESQDEYVDYNEEDEVGLLLEVFKKQQSQSSDEQCKAYSKSKSKSSKSKSSSEK